MIESFVRFEAGRVRLTGGFEAAAGPRIGAVLARPGPAVVALERGASSFRVNNILAAGGHVAVPQTFPWIGPAVNPLLGLGRDTGAGGEAGPEPGGGELHPAQEGRSEGEKKPQHGGQGN